MNVEGMPNINASIDALFSAIDNTIPLVQEFLKDTSFPLEDRWALFLKSESLLPTSRFYPDHLRILTDSPYDDLNLERYQAELPSTIDESLVENYDPDYDPLTDDDGGREYQQKAHAMYAKRDEWREAVLAEGCGQFTYDW